MLFGPEGLNLDAPPAFLLPGEHRFRLVSGHLGTKQTRSQGRADELDHGVPPRLHQLVAVVVDARHPGAGRLQPSRGLGLCRNQPPPLSSYL